MRLKMSTFSRFIFSSTLKKRQEIMFPFMLSCRNVQLKPKNKGASYIFNEYLSFKSRADKSKFIIMLQKMFPKTMKMYDYFMTGIKGFKNDIIVWYKTVKKARAEGWNSVSRRELEIYHQMSTDLIRTTPIIFMGCFIPFGAVIAIALGHYYPKQVYTHHFWSTVQKNQFSLLDHRKKLMFYEPVFKSMQSCLKTIQNDPLYGVMRHMLQSLENGIHPNVEFILSSKPLFEKSPYGLTFLEKGHTVALLKIHGIEGGLSDIKKLERRAFLIQLMDAAIVKEGGVNNLTQDEIKWNCFFRGLNPDNMKNEAILDWLKTWLSISEKIDKNSYSLLLHCPILLGYKTPSNLALYQDTKMSL